MKPFPFSGAQQLTFTLVATPDAYATESYVLGDSFGPVHSVMELSIHIIAITATAQIEVDLLKPGGDPDTAGDWNLAAGGAFTAAGLQDLVELANWPGVRIRCKSGGTAGTTTANESHW